MAQDGAHTVTFKKDPLNDRRAMISAMEGFKGSEFPKNPFKDGKPQTAIDEFYSPHAGGEKK